MKAIMSVLSALIVLSSQMAQASANMTFNATEPNMNDRKVASCPFGSQKSREEDRWILPTSSAKSETRPHQNGKLAQ